MSIDPRRVKELFVAALDLADAQAREGFLDRECGGDAELRQRLEILLKANDDPASALERPLAAVAEVDAAATSSPAPANGPATVSHHGPAEDVGSVIAGRYKLLQQIGEGGMGSVFMAEQTRPVKRLVAVKVIKAGMDSKQVLARFESERQALALMDHPNIAKVLDAGTTERGHPFFVMELVKGVPLTQFCDDRQLSVGDRLKIFQQICHAVQHAHQKGIIHRDLKPTNILVESHDGRPVPKIIDFGLAKAMNALPLTERSLFTNFGSILGTPLYMAPEQAEFTAIDVDTRADIYALGVILYELLTGTTPLEKKRFAAAAWDEIRRVIKEEEPPKPSNRLSANEARASIAAQRQTEPNKLGKFVRGDLDWIVMKALAKERDRRYETANAFAADVERFLNDEPVSAGPPTLGYKFRKFVHRNRAQVTVAAVLLFALVAGVTVSTWQAVRARRAEGRALDEREKTAQALTIAEQNRQAADEQRKKAETQAASLAVDIDLKYCEDGEVALGLLRLAETLKSIPEHAKELRECAALNILAWGQKIRPAIGPLTHDGYAVTQAILSPDGRTVLSLGRDGTPRLWDSISGKQRKILGQPLQAIQKGQGLLQFSKDGSTALDDTSYSRPHAFRGTVRLWDVATGQLRMTLSQIVGWAGGARLSRNGSVLVTCVSDQNAVLIWNAMTGQLLRQVACQGRYGPSIDVSPDGRWVLIAQDGQFAVWSPESDQPLKRLPGDNAVFSPTGRSAASVSGDTLHWWDSKDWQLHRTINLSKPFPWLEAELSFITEEVLGVRLSSVDPPFYQLVVLRNLPETIREVGDSYESWRNAITASRDGRVVFLGSHVYDGLSGQRIPLAPGRKFHPELSQLSEDGRFTPFHVSYIVDLAADKKIDFSFRDRNISEWRGDGRFVKDLETWVVLSSDRIYVLRKADASLDPELLQKWCQVVTRSKLDEGGHFSKLDEAAWEKARLELARLLEANPNAQSLRAAVSDPLYWLRQEIKDSESRDPPVSPLPLLDRLVAAEPTWPNYSQRAASHAKQKHWDLAIQDEFEAARLTGERYWLGGTTTPFPDWQVGACSVQSPGRPQEQYERALRWVEARTRAGVDDEQGSFLAAYRLRRTTIAGLALFRLGRYAEALATLRKSDVPMISEAARMLMSPWNLPSMMTYRVDGRPDSGITIRRYDFDPVDLLVRAMCHHHLGHPKEAKACLNVARGILPKDEKAMNADQRAFLREAESLIEGKPSP